MSRLAAAQLAVLAVAAAVALTACGGGGSSDQIVEPAPTTVGTLSKESARQPIVQDLNAVREVLTSSRADEAVSGVYDLLNEAGAKKDVNQGAALIRRRLPGLVEQLDVSYPKVRTSALRLRLKTEAGAKFRTLGLFVLAEDRRELDAFRADVARSRLTWGAVVRFGDKNNASVKRLDARLDALLQGLRPSERRTLMQAMGEVFGR